MLTAPLSARSVRVVSSASSSADRMRIVGGLTIFATAGASCVVAAVFDVSSASEESGRLCRNDASAVSGGESSNPLGLYAARGEWTAKDTSKPSTQSARALQSSSASVGDTPPPLATVAFAESSDDEGNVDGTDDRLRSEERADSSGNFDVTDDRGAGNSGALSTEPDDNAAPLKGRSCRMAESATVEVEDCAGAYRTWCNASRC